MTEYSALLNRLFSAPVLEEVNAASLERMVEDYPYFAHARWFRAAKDAGIHQNGQMLEEAAAFAYHPLRLERLLTSRGKTAPASASAPPPAPVPAEEASIPHAGESRPAEEPAAATGTPVPAEEASIPHAGESRPAEEPAAATGTPVPAEEASIPHAGESRPAEEPAAATGTPLIQPLFTEDYFAYTGARLPLHLENDKKPTMEQLRSFTDWLRAMKRPKGSPDPDIQQDAASLAAREENEHAFIRHYAENSLATGREIYTEAMAEVRLSAGQTDKAIAIYEKLSLYNPEKSAYFAQKIADLKNK